MPVHIRTEFNYAFGYSERVHIGPDSWLHYRSVLDREKVRNASLSVLEVERIADRLERVRKYLSTRGVRMLVVTVPQKDVELS